MKEKIKILIVEDTVTDAELCEHEIGKEIKNCTFRRVETEEEFRHALKEFKPDLILSDYWLPRFTGLDALKITLNQSPDLPFIVVTGSMNEETAVACIKAGAWDYVIKEHMKRLGQAVKSALEQKEERKQRKKAEGERNLLVAAVEQTGEIIFITDRDGRILYVNSAAENITGYKKEEILGQNPRIFNSGRQTENFYRTLWETILSGHSWRGKIINKKKDGSLYTEEAAIYPIRGESGEIENFVAVKRDVTELLALQEEKDALQAQFLQAQKMESIGRLAGGIAHDFNNMLGVILGHVEVALRELEADSSVRYHLQEILKAAEKSAELTRQLLTFARRQPFSPRVVNLNEILKENVSLLRRVIPENISLDWETEEDLWLVEVDPSQVIRIVMNLVTNARDAIPGSGHIRIKMMNRFLDEDWCLGRPLFKEGEYVVIEVSDDGVGMDETTLTYIFEPFFTTKPLGQGTGMGLATVYGIVKQHGGFIDVKSAPNSGTSFFIYLPRYIGEIKEEKREEKGGETVKGRGELILLVEDEVDLLQIGRILLEKMGYRVLATTSPGEALELAKTHKDEIKLLITDLVMPEMNGMELVSKVRVYVPNIPSILSSGYGSFPHLWDTNIEFLEKPYTAETLSNKIRKVLGQE